MRYIKKDIKKKLMVVIMLGGIFMFAADLVRQIKLPMKIKRVSAESMKGDKSTGVVKIIISDGISFKGEDVLIVEDIVDTGLTVHETIKENKKLGAKSVKLCSLLSKPSKTVHSVKIDYLGFEVKDFVVGYGLDFNDSFRELSYIGIYRK